MSDEVYGAIARASSGFVESPAGCGKTEAIVRTVGTFCADPQLILTHTHAGVDALRRRFREHRVPAAKYHVDTIAGWSWGWVRKYPSNGNYPGSTDIAVWDDVYAAMLNLLQKDFVQQGVLNSYAGVIVDEYQDCTLPMHRLVVALKRLLPCRVLGDDLQGIFGFAGESLIDWADVKTEFGSELGPLITPFRWLKVGNEPLGRWLLSARVDFRLRREPDYQGSPIERRTVRYGDLGKELIRLTHEKDERICMIGPKARPLPAALTTTLVKQGYRVLEANELSALRDLVIALTDGLPPEKAKATADFFARAHGGLGDDLEFIGKISRGDSQSPRRPDRRALCQKHNSGTTPRLISDLLEYVGQISGTSCKLRESVSALKCILEDHFDTGAEIKALYAQEIAKRKQKSRSDVYRSIGSTLLVKGLEFEHAVILRNADWQKSWGGYKDLYVALTRGARTVTLIELAK
jgi:AAA domain